MTTVIHTEEFCKWILAQPDDKPVRMEHSRGSKHQCCCLMVQYGEEVLGYKKDTIQCSYCGIYTEKCMEIPSATFENRVSISYFVPANVWFEARRFKDIKPNIETILNNLARLNNETD